MIQLVFLLEERSARAMIEGLLPTVIPYNKRESIEFKFIVFEGKQDLDKHLKRKLDNYQVPYARFIVLRDQDSSDCRQLKDKLLSECSRSKATKYIVRIACRELESWYFGDLEAVKSAFPEFKPTRRLGTIKNPDMIDKPSKVLMEATKGLYQKISGSRAIGPYLNPVSNNSPSFKAFLNGINKALD